MRTILAALALATLAACVAARAHTVDMSGIWVAEETEGQRDWVGAFRAELVQDATGRLSGVGAIDPCPRCAGFMEYDLTWEGGFEGDVLVLTGTPERVRGRHTVVRFEGRAVGQGFDGVLSGLSGGQTMNVRMVRAD